MDENKLRFGVGVLVIGAIGIGIILTFLFGAFPTVLTDDYTLLVKFPSAGGISTNTPVLRDGVRIGRVSDISLEKDQGVLLTLKMTDRYRLTHAYQPRIGTGSVITGDATLEFVRIDEQQLAKELEEGLPIEDVRAFMATPITEGEYIKYGKKADDPFNVLFDLEDDVRATMDSIRLAGERIQQAGSSVNELAEEVRGVIGGGDGQINDLSQQAVKTLEEFQGAIRDVRDVLGSQEIQDNIEATFQTLPEVLSEAQNALKRSQGTFDQFEQMGKQFQEVGEVAEETVKTAKLAIEDVRTTVQGVGETLDGVGRTIDNIEKFTEPLGERGEELIAQVLQSLRSADRALAQVEQFGNALNNNDGTLKRLLEDEELYYQIQRTVRNIEEASARIRPVMDDVRIFTDKIARDPRQLGVRGAITKRPNGAGLK